MKTIFKYEAPLLDYKVIRGRIEKFLTVAYQKTSESICVWALVDDQLEEKDYVISCYGTGHTLPDVIGEYLGTIQLYSGEMMLHYFIEGPEVQRVGGYRKFEESNTFMN